MLLMLTGATGLFGLAIGSFLNVVIYRVPAGLSVVRPASACPGCSGSIRRRDNIPVLSWLMLGGRCRDCRMAISARYPLIEALTGLSFVALALAWLPRMIGASDSAHAISASIELVALLYLAAISIALSMIDVDVQRLPNSVVGPAYLVVTPLLVIAAVVSGEPSRLVTAAIGSGASLLFYAILWFAYPGGMGEGDVKLSGLLGAVLGYFGTAQLIVGTMSAFVLGGVFGIALVVIRRSGRKTGIPFGPWMLAGLWIGVIAGAPLAGAYLSLFGLT